MSASLGEHFQRDEAIQEALQELRVGKKQECGDTDDADTNGDSDDGDAAATEADTPDAAPADAGAATEGDYVKPDVVHVMLDGSIVQSGGPELALELEEKGYEWLKD